MPLSIKVNLRVTGHCNQGGRKYMEDMFSVAYQQTSDDKDLEYAFFGIFDGHGGGEAATFAKEHLMDIIVKQKNFWSDKDEDVLRAIRDGYVNTHYAMWRELDKWPRTASGLPSTAGTTASIAFIRKGKIYIGHVGDSGIVLGYQDDGDLPWKAKALTKDHKPESGPEMTRIQESGGKVVSKSGVPRVVWNRPRIGHKGPVRRSTHIDEIPFLAVARSLGDLWSYNSELDTFVVSPEPDVKVITVDVKSHRCLIFGTDGLWNMLTPQAAVAIVQAAERYNEKHFIASQQTGDGADTQRWINPSKSLVDRALERWSSTRLRADNTSVVTLMLDPPGPSRGEVLLNRKKERLSSPKCIPVSPSSYTPSPCNGNTERPANPLPQIPSMPKIEKHNNCFEPKRPISPSWIVHENVPRNNINESNVHADTKTFAPYQYERFEGNDGIGHGTVKGNSNIDNSTNVESIQVAEISSSDASTNETVVQATPVCNLINATTPHKEENVINNNKSNGIIETNLTTEKICESQNTVENEKTYDVKTEQKTDVSGQCNNFNYGSKLRRSTTELTTTNVISYAESSYTENVKNTLIVDHYKRRHQSNSISSHLEKCSNLLGINRSELRSAKLRRQCSANNSSQLAPTTSTSYSNDDHKILIRPIESRLKRESPLRPGVTPLPLEPSICTKRRHSSTFESAEDVTCSDQEPCSKRRTRSEDQRCPTDENNPINQSQRCQESQQHCRLRWPNSCSIASKSRTSNTPTTSCQTAGIVAVNNQDKLASPNSFPRRSLEKKATSVKTIRRPSINGSNRVQLRGSFGLRDWDQSKSSRRSNCSSDRSRLNRTINNTITDPTSPPTPQRWLRSDTIAATPIKTLRSRNVDIAGHTVPPQIAHQYGIVKQNRMSLPTKLKMSNSTKVKSPAALTPSKLKQTTHANGSSPSVSAAVSGIAKRVKSSAYNLSARSLGTRSRLKRLSK